VHVGLVGCDCDSDVALLAAVGHPAPAALKSPASSAAEPAPLAGALVLHATKCSWCKREGRRLAISGQSRLERLAFQRGCVGRDLQVCDESVPTIGQLLLARLYGLKHGDGQRLGCLAQTGCSYLLRRGVGGLRWADGAHGCRDEGPHAVEHHARSTFRKLARFNRIGDEVQRDGRAGFLRVLGELARVAAERVDRVAKCKSRVRLCTLLPRRIC